MLRLMEGSFLSGTRNIIIDDDVCPNLLNMTDNYICRAYKRQSNNPAWTGKYFIVTSNYTFDEWIAMCKLGEKHYEAAHSRFYICEIRQNQMGQIILL